MDEFMSQSASTYNIYEANNNYDAVMTEETFSKSDETFVTVGLQESGEAEPGGQHGVGVEDDHQRDQDVLQEPPRAHHDVQVPRHLHRGCK